ncbi:MAG: hypothetical protein E7K72_22765 [Roseomonas mucosa]|nr:hypothetical protein [Roseomonas mucosa]
MPDGLAIATEVGRLTRRTHLTHILRFWESRAADPARALDRDRYETMARHTRADLAAITRPTDPMIPDNTPPAWDGTPVAPEQEETLHWLRNADRGRIEAMLWRGDMWWCIEPGCEGFVAREIITSGYSYIGPVSLPATDTPAPGISPRVVADTIRERSRQISMEGFTRDHDDQYQPNVLASAAACYALSHEPWGIICRFWPKSWRGWWKPRDRRRDLAERVSILLNAIGEELSRQADRPVSERRLDRLQGLAGRRFLQDSGLHLFIAAANLGLIEVPEPDSDE